VPFAAGGGTGLIARARRAADEACRRHVVISRPGASTNIGTAAVVNAPADGPRAAAHQHFARRQSALYRKLATRSGHRPDRLIANSPSILVVNPRCQ
jgi:tripartite-type tricarboxylate transporter receptor subunit TctC